MLSQKRTSLTRCRWLHVSGCEFCLNGLELLIVCRLPETAPFIHSAANVHDLFYPFTLIIFFLIVDEWLILKEANLGLHKL